MEIKKPWLKYCLIVFNILVLVLSLYIIFANLYGLVDINMDFLMVQWENRKKFINIILGIGVALIVWNFSNKEGISRVNNLGILTIFFAFLMENLLDISSEIIKGFTLTEAFRIHPVAIVSVPLYAIVVGIQIYEVLFNSSDRKTDA